MLSLHNDTTIRFDTSFFLRLRFHWLLIRHTGHCHWWMASWPAAAGHYGLIADWLLITPQYALATPYTIQYYQFITLSPPQPLPLDCHWYAGYTIAITDTPPDAAAAPPLPRLAGHWFFTGITLVIAATRWRFADAGRHWLIDNTAATDYTMAGCIDSRRWWPVSFHTDYDYPPSALSHNTATILHTIEVIAGQEMPHNISMMPSFIFASCGHNVTASQLISCQIHTMMIGRYFHTHVIESYWSLPGWQWPRARPATATAEVNIDYYWLLIAVAWPASHNSHCIDSRWYWLRYTVIATHWLIEADCHCRPLIHYASISRLP